MTHFTSSLSQFMHLKTKHKNLHRSSSITGMLLQINGKCDDGFYVAALRHALQNVKY